MQVKIEILDLGDGKYKAQIVSDCAQPKLLFESDEFDAEQIEGIGDRYVESNAWSTLGFKVLDKNFNYFVKQAYYANAQ